MISASDRLQCLTLIDEVKALGASLKSACQLIGIDERTYYRWKKKLKLTGVVEDLRPSAQRPVPANAMTQAEIDTMFNLLNSSEFADASPRQIVPALADRGIYVGSESTMYRQLHKRGMCHHRRKGKVPTKRSVPTHSASSHNQVWMWDITYIPGPVKGQFFYLYLISDLFSRYIVGWEIWEEQSADLASDLIRKTALAEHIPLNSLLVLHSDNGSPMRAATMLATMQSLGVVPSFSRPRVSNDNAFAESLFNTLKSRAGYRDNGFESLDAARKWVATFVDWYRNKHHHSGISYMTPQQRHNGNWREVVDNRTAVYEAAKKAHPERWNGRSTRNWTAPEVVHLNPVKED